MKILFFASWLNEDVRGLVQAVGCHSGCLEDEDAAHRRVVPDVRWHRRWDFLGMMLILSFLYLRGFLRMLKICNILISDRIAGRSGRRRTRDSKVYGEWQLRVEYPVHELVHADWLAVKRDDAETWCDPSTVRCGA